MSAAEWIQALSAALAVSFGGVWALYNFGLTRVGSPHVRLEVRLDGVLTRHDDQIAILACAATNAGRRRVHLSSAHLTVASVDIAADWAQFTRYDNIDRSEEEVYAMFQGHQFLDPGEKLDDAAALNVREIRLLECELRLRGSRPHESWATRRLLEIPSGPESASAAT